MKKFFFITLLTGFALAADSQQNWDVIFKKKTLLKNVEENIAANMITIKKSDLNSKNPFTIKFNNQDTANIITLEAYTDSRSGLQSWKFTGKQIIIKGADFKKLFSGQSRIHFHYMAIPKDPALAALVRIRPIHVCTVVLQ